MATSSGHVQYFCEFNFTKNVICRASMGDDFSVILLETQFFLFKGWFPILLIFNRSQSQHGPVGDFVVLG